MVGSPHPYPRAVGRYMVGEPIAAGGMSTLHLGKLNGSVGFRRTVAIKRMLGSLAGNPRARAMLIDEARMASRVSHANVVQTLDVVEDGEELLLVLDYVDGESLDRLLERCREAGRPPPVRVTVAILVGALRGLHAAHEARGEDGHPLELVHRDLSPQNIIVDVNGIARVLDFGVARARGRLQATDDGQLKGKLSYLAPEQVHGDASRRSDLFSAGVVLWECLCGRKLFEAPTEAGILSSVLLCKVPRLAKAVIDAPAIQAVLDRALEPEPDRRFATAGEMADALEACGAASTAEVAAWVVGLAADGIEVRARRLEELDRLVARGPPETGERRAGASLAVRRWLVIGGAALVPLAVAAYVLASRAGRDEPDPPRDKPPETRIEAAPVPPAPPPVVATPAPAPAPAKQKPPRGAVPATSAAETCDPPFVIDPSGVKRFKIRCLK